MVNPQHRKILGVLFLTSSLVAATSSYASQPIQISSASDVFELSLEDLMNIEVTSVSKKRELAREASSALFVITDEDIRRMGATSIPEVLRIAPGIQVSQIDSNKWAVSSRGFNEQFTNDLLVLMDGRSIYNPIFSGVYWDTQDLVLDDIERIEVIRGPGATVWGANAVNGVINIITKSAKDTEGKYATVTYGNHERGIVEARQGGKIGENGHYRAYAKYTNRDETKNLSGNGNHDGWYREQVGFRSDFDNLGSERTDNATIQGDIYYGNTDYELVFPSLSAPYSTSQLEKDDVSGGNILGRWTREFSKDSSLTLQAYFDQYRRNETLGEQVVSTYDFDMSHQFKTSDRNEIVWGAGYRVQKDEIGGNTRVQMTDYSSIYDLFSAFAQDQYALIPEKLFLTIGAKTEVNDFTGLNFQPSAKIAWHVDDTQTVWGSIARAVETPNRLMDGVAVQASAIPSNALFAGSPAGFSKLVGQGLVDDQYLTAYEVGYRVSPKKRVSLDFSAFYNDYADLVTTELGTPFVETNSLFYPPHISIPITFDNKSSAESFGFEFAGNWQVKENWKLSASYSYIDIDVKLDPGGRDTTQIDSVNGTPKHMFNIRSNLNLPHDIEVDNILYFTDNFEGNGFTSTLAVPEYWRFDTRVGWNFSPNAKLELIGQNLLDERHSEQSAPVYGHAAQIDRSIFARVTLKY